MTKHCVINENTKKCMELGVGCASGKKSGTWSRLAGSSTEKTQSKHRNVIPGKEGDTNARLLSDN